RNIPPRCGGRRRSSPHPSSASDVVASLLIRGGTILTLNDRFDVVEGDLSIVDGRIAAIGRTIASRHDRAIPARGGCVPPGPIQTHKRLRTTKVTAAPILTISQSFSCFARTLGCKVLWPPTFTPLRKTTCVIAPYSRFMQFSTRSRRLLG